MEADIIFKNDSKSWSREEDIQIKKLYNENMLNIIEISKIHNRSPDQIIFSLMKYNCIDNPQSARGYTAHKNSKYEEALANKIYKNKMEMVDEQNKNREIKINSTQIDNILISINKSDYKELQNDVKEMKNEIKGLKIYIKELFEMMKVVYEF